RHLVLLCNLEIAGLFDISHDPDFVIKELVKCFDLAKDGIHALLLVLSVRTRFSKEEQASVKCFLDLYERKISDYMIVVFTGGDELEENDVILDDYLDHCPEPLEVESKLWDMRHLKAELAKELAARLQAEQNAEAALMNLEDMSSMVMLS
ncbi:hypothetical protein H5410_040669, partial [Solanum commersonii]